jgi:hypothetical protein
MNGVPPWDLGAENAFALLLVKSIALYGHSKLSSTRQ